MPGAIDFSVRKATFLDLDAMVDIALAAMPMDPQWDYRFPRRHQYPEDTRAFTRQRYLDFLSDDCHWEVHVVQTSDAQGRFSRTPVAFAVWEVANLRVPQNLNHKTISTPEKRMRQDASQSRMNAWTAAMRTSRSRLFDDVYGTNHLHLQILAVHPDHQRRGAGSALCAQGMRTAEQQQMAVSVFASPMGRRLYRRLGFQDVGEVTVQAKGEQEYVKVAALSYEPPNLWSVTLLSRSQAAHSDVSSTSLTALAAAA